ncbi:hypothetical protein [Nitrosomonas oligotropha]|uniref:Uncharacterized protein n=1 Tax=Nitrosomonas oligotropha TaxID=42354 RepID=A0A1H8VJS6_9PROT|nr:hypothetical protein [Nitrosomonas oligotropha]SDX61517.1 hypothetical protein SAMN05216300_1624 [Nitrosomonas oligotropha]SEP15583.1 hypothetical protein SAMN05216333_1614 [Nitrosomonas oligotropha]
MSKSIFKKYWKLSDLISIMICLLPLTVSANAVVDIESQLRQKLQNHPSIVNIPNKYALSFPTLNYFSNKISFQPNEQKFPTNIRTQSFIFENCTTSVQEHTKDIRVAKKFSLDATVTDAITTRTEFSVGLKFDSDKVPVKMDANLAKSFEFSVSHTDTTRVEKEIEESMHEVRKVKPGMALMINSSVVENISRFNFSAPVIVTGTVKVNYYEKRSTRRSDLERLAGKPKDITVHLEQEFKLEDLLAEADRKFVAAGYIDSVYSDEVRMKYVEKKIKNNREICPATLMSTKVEATTITDDIQAEKEEFVVVDFNGREIALSETKLEEGISYKSIDKTIDAQIENHFKEYDKLIVAIPKTDISVNSSNDISDFGDITAMGPIIRQFFARGEHTCQSRSSIGHKCEVRGSGFFDCNEAEYDLRNKSCCSSTPKGGSSIGFRITKCSTLTP